MNILILIFLGSLALSAQQPAAGDKPSPASAAATQDPSAEGIRVRGCLVGDKRLTFVQEATGAMFRLTGNDSQFEKYRGKFTELSVKELPPAAQSGTDELPDLKVERVAELAPTCPMRMKSLPEAGKTRAIGQGVGTPKNQSSGPASPGTNNNPNGAGANGAPSAGTGNTPPPK